MLWKILSHASIMCPLYITAQNSAWQEESTKTGAGVGAMVAWMGGKELPLPPAVQFQTGQSWLAGMFLMRDAEWPVEDSKGYTVNVGVDGSAKPLTAGWCRSGSICKQPTASRSVQPGEWTVTETRSRAVPMGTRQRGCQTGLPQS